MRSATASLARSVRIALAAASTSSGSILAAHATENPCEPEIVRAAEHYRIPIGILYAVGLAETGRKGTLQPNALNIEGKALFPASPNAAVAAVEQARHRGARLIDVGCMQINHHYHGEAFKSVREMFDPKGNVEYAAHFLNELKAREGSWTMAVARYHAGPNNNPAQKRYVCSVIANMVATGFGSWTPEARSFCK
jgi:soluble lytic murein transglycosylase-like protein